ncbi:MAG: type II toxin-antitoxin system Phd/YefM family antitoxin [Isosphaeraceae bacterium]
MGTVGISDFEAVFLELLARVAQGERITIVQHGKAIAQLVPVKSEPGDYDIAVDRMMEFRRGRGFDSVNLREMAEEGRRF